MNNVISNRIRIFNIPIEDRVYKHIWNRIEHRIEIRIRLPIQIRLKAIVSHA